jgi:hypothetical protein
MANLKLVPLSPYNTDTHVLHCPSCGSDYLHHELIEVFERREDATYGLHVAIDNGRMRADTDVSVGNPSSRRDGLTVDFWCEGCWKISRLSIAQHKGNTWIEFKLTGRDRDPMA